MVRAPAGWLVVWGASIQSVFKRPDLARRMDVTMWQCGGTKVTIPRHREVNELTAQAIFKTLESELGRGWWRR